jgi:hypothetical protein
VLFCVLLLDRTQMCVEIVFCALPMRGSLAYVAPATHSSVYTVQRDACEDFHRLLQNCLIRSDCDLRRCR